MVSAWHVGGTRGLGIVFSEADLLWMNAVPGMRGVRGVCAMCMCLSRGGVGGEGVSGSEDLVWALPILCEQYFMNTLDVCLCFGCGGVCCVGGEWVGGLDQGMEGWDGVMSV